MSRLRLAKISTPSSPPSTTAELFYSLSDAKLEAIDENGKVAVLGGFAAADYRLIRVFWITASTTYTPTTGTRALYVECVGGGGGGGSAKTTSSNASSSGGGGAGGYSASFLTGLAASYTVTIGAAGAAGAGGNAGGAGGNTSFGSNPTANGGSGGGAGTSAGTGFAVSGGGAGGAAGSGDLAIGGVAGSPGYILSAAQAFNGAGASNIFGAAGPAGIVATTPGPGNSATGYGAGGSGGANAGTQGTAAAGGAGAGGAVRVWEFA